MRKSSPLLVSPVMMTGLTVVIATILLASNFTIINAQSQQFTSQAGVIENIAAPAMFQSMDDSIRVQVPSGWIIQDIDNAGPAQLEEGRQGYGMLMQLCPEEQATAATPPAATTNSVSSINASRCLGAQEVIHIIRYPDLDGGLPANNGLTTTIDNALTYHMQKLQDVGYRSMRIVNSTDTAINIINPQTNQTITTVPAKLVEMTYSTNFAPNEMKRGYFILTAANETVPNVGTTKGYSVFYEGNSIIGTGITATTTSASPILQPTPLPTAVQQVVDSFELIAAPQATQSVVQTGQAAQGDCDPSYPEVCIASPPPDLNCDDEGVPENFEVSGSDPHGFDGDNDGVGCDLQVDSDDDDEADEEEGDDNVGARDDGVDSEEDDNEADEEDDNGGDNSCDPSYPEVCIASPPPDLNCDDEGVPENFEVSGSDPHGFDGDNDGVGCESGSNAPVDNSNEDDGDNEREDEGGESDNGVSGEPQPEPESEPGSVEGGGVEGGVSGEPQPEPGEGGGGGGGEGNEAGNNPNEFADCIVPEGMDPGDVGC